MTSTEEIELLISNKGHEHFRWLISGENPDVETREKYRGMAMRSIVDRLETVGPTVAPDPDAGRSPQIPLDVSLRVLKTGYRNCWFSTNENKTGCACVRCHLHDKIVGLRDCVRCLS